MHDGLCTTDCAQPDPRPSLGEKSLDCTNQRGVVVGFRQDLSIRQLLEIAPGGPQHNERRVMLAGRGIECIAESIIVRGVGVEVQDDDFGMVTPDQFQSFARAARRGRRHSATLQQRVQHLAAFGRFIHDDDSRRPGLVARIMPS